MTHADEEARAAGRIDHVIFGNDGGIRPVAWSVRDGGELDWIGRNLDKFVGLENFLDKPPPDTAFSYLRLSEDLVAVIRRHDDGTGSRGRSRADVLIGHPRHLGPATALGLDGLDVVWDVGVPDDRRLPDIDARTLVDQAAKERTALLARRSDVRQHAQQVLAAMGTYPGKRLLLVGMPEDLKKALLLVVDDVRRLHPDTFGPSTLTFSSYEAHSQDVQGAPGIVFVPDHPGRGTRRVVVDLSLRGRSRDLPSPDMLATADEALGRLLGDRPAQRAVAASDDTVQQPALIGAGEGRTAQAPPGVPAGRPDTPSRPDRGRDGIDFSYADTGGGAERPSRGEGSPVPEPDEPTADRPLAPANEWVAGLEGARTLKGFTDACRWMMQEQPDPAGRRAALTPATMLLNIYERGRSLPVDGGWNDPVVRPVLALAFGKDYAELDTPEGAEYLFGLVRATARCSGDDLDRVKDLMAEVVHEYRSRPWGSAALTRVLADDYFESLGLDPIRARPPTRSSRVPGSGGGISRLLSRLTVGAGGGRSAGDRLRVAVPSNGPAAAGPTETTGGRGRPSFVAMGAGLGVLLAAVFLVLALLQGGDDGPTDPGSPSPVPSQAEPAPADAETTENSNAGSSAEPIRVEVMDLAPEQIAALPLEAGGQIPDAVVYVVWRGTSTGSVVPGVQCLLEPAGGPTTAYECERQDRPTRADPAGVWLVVVSDAALYQENFGQPITTDLDESGLVVGMTSLTEPESYK